MGDSIDITTSLAVMWAAGLLLGHALGWWHREAEYRRALRQDVLDRLGAGGTQ